MGPGGQNAGQFLTQGQAAMSNFQNMQRLSQSMDQSFFTDMNQMVNVLQKQNQLQNNPLVGTANFPNNLNNNPASAFYPSDNSMAQNLFHQKTNSIQGGLSAYSAGAGLGLNQKGGFPQPNSIPSQQFNNYSGINQQALYNFLKSNGIDSSKNNGSNPLTAMNMNSYSHIN